ncbi:3-methyl-2-oxobutanoate dehydrogenase [Dictyostelium purpureum]|uniref:2-oxoisovalerate dehydrogenase subunit alpha n=1 Tax=Dictyostelium purpureum TaxID=5786 RepID=F0ZUJ1_DICPU|nr:3-methyl-2-oxobutanoate dehydrogenase [Dictyostelium purpureum]EGC32402.1 3-methyl-2-oxobutanoate dehydrogenase [Dictyostelium purpureum]|eukprot:XP_003291088.1 3-methyl-2-oxobutanoate dehydrogenase [Dictyostelium purpureum]
MISQTSRVLLNLSKNNGLKRVASNYLNRSVVSTSSKTNGIRSFSSKVNEIKEEKENFQYTNNLEVQELKHYIPCYTIMNQEGIVQSPEQDPNFSKEEVVKMYSTMVTLSVMDSVLYDVQRQGRISFYMTSFGEEAIHVGSAAALEMSDTIFAQYRETGVFMWRGFTIADIINQCCTNEHDLGKGRQMPMHFGSKKINLQTISSPLTTQLPQAVGSSYAQKLAGEKSCTIVYFGEGAASEGDFHAAMNFASALSTPTIFFCRNNKWAISTPSKEQYKGDGIAGRGPNGYGMKTIRVDGNDIWAVYNATKLARKITVEEQRPVLIEAMTYRVGHHSTSDDSSRYRTVEEINHWKEGKNPITRLRNYMDRKGWWSDAQEKELITEARQTVRDSLVVAEKQFKPSISEIFTDVYHTPTPNLIEQQQELLEHLRLYPDEYPLNQYLDSDKILKNN